MKPIISYRTKSGVVRKGFYPDIPLACSMRENRHRCNEFYRALFAAGNANDFVRCPFGYAVWLAHEGLEPIAFFGLMVRDVISKSKHADAGLHMPKLPRERAIGLIEKELECLRYEHSCKKSEHLKSEMLHGMEKILGTCHSKAEELLAIMDRDADSVDWDSAMTHLRTILLGNIQLRNQFYATKLRYDDELSTKRFPTAVHTKFYKAMKLLRRYHGSNVTIKFEGESYNRYDLTASFEMLPYLLLENAVKFSPSGSEVKVEFYESEKELEVVISNIGPITRKTASELCKDRIRGEHSEEAGVEGSGIGLFTCASIANANMIGFCINPAHERTIQVNSIGYGWFEVRLKFSADTYQGQIRA